MDYKDKGEGLNDISLTEVKDNKEASDHDSDKERESRPT
jgi:hypothetical protein